MTGRRPNLYWRLTWRVVSPLLLLSIFLSYIVLLAQRPPSYKAWNPQYVGSLYGSVGSLGPCALLTLRETLGAQMTHTWTFMPYTAACLGQLGM